MHLCICSLQEKKLRVCCPLCLGCHLENQPQLNLITFPFNLKSTKRVHKLYFNCKSITLSRRRKNIERIWQRLPTCSMDCKAKSWFFSSYSSVSQTVVSLLNYYHCFQWRRNLMFKRTSCGVESRMKHSCKPVIQGNRQDKNSLKFR